MPMWATLKDFGAIGDGVADDTAAAAAFINALKSGPVRTGFVESGEYRLTSPLPALDAPITIQGDNPQTTAFLRQYNGVPGVGVFHITGGGKGATLSRFGILSSGSGGALISGVSSSTISIGTIVLEDLILSTASPNGNTHENTLFFDGSARTTGAIGIRSVELRNVKAFGCTGYTAELKCVEGFKWAGGGPYGAGGTGAASGAIRVSGTPTLPSVNVSIDVDAINYLNLTNTQCSTFRAQSWGHVGGVSIANDGSVASVTVFGNPPGVVTANWQNSSVYRS